MFSNRTFEIEEIPSKILISKEEASKDLKVKIDIEHDTNYLGYIDIYNNFKAVTYREKKIRVED
ncbi:hypothetical protein [Clostridium sp.]|uniref:hypothetical protein n=1 Tax=Clostridium sp. TaxID=1506 RepID=UPI002FCB4B8C